MLHPLRLLQIATLFLTTALGTAAQQDKEKPAPMATSPDGKLIATASGGQIIFTHVATNKTLLKIPAHKGDVTALAFSPDGQKLASGGRDMSVRLWTATGQRIRSLEGHQAVIEAVRFAADGTTLTTHAADGKTHIWDVATGKQLQ
jgi:WD40 repeat protein